MTPNLSKTLFLRGLQCHKALWLLKNSPELAVKPDEALLARFAEGHEAGELARGLFPGGELVEYEKSKTKMCEKTRDLIDGGVSTIYEATFSYDNILVMVDILHRGHDGWEIYEVKSSTTVKDINKADLALQLHVLMGAGLSITKASLAHINNSYVRHGDIDIHKLFTIEDLTEEMWGLLEAVRKDVVAMRSDLCPECPKIDIGPHCTVPYDCDFRPHCWAHVPEPSVFNINHLLTEKKFDLYYRGILEFSAIPKSFPLNKRQRMQVEAELTNKEFLDKEGIRSFLDSLHYPMYFLDFETFQQAIPHFDGTRPYEQIPFQFSLHILEKQGAPLGHHELLAESWGDPRLEIATRLVQLIPKSACVVAYNMGFEKSVIRNLAERHPAHGDSLLKINENMRDLMVPFRSGQCYTKEMNGSASLKAVLPALVPELGYESMAIGGGQEASAAYGKLHRVIDKAEEERIQKALLEYCKLDTLAMVKLIEKLRKYANGSH